MGSSAQIGLAQGFTAPGLPTATRTRPLGAVRPPAGGWVAHKVKPGTVVHGSAGGRRDLNEKAAITPFDKQGLAVGKTARWRRRQGRVANQHGQLITDRPQRLPDNPTVERAIRNQGCGLGRHKRRGANFLTCRRRDAQSVAMASIPVANATFDAVDPSWWLA